MNRAYSVLTVKAIDEDKRVIRGVATTPSVDRVGDIIDPLGVKFENPLAFLWQHRHDQPIGSVKFDKPTKDGIVTSLEIFDPAGQQIAWMFGKRKPGQVEDSAWPALALKAVGAAG